MKNEKHVFNEGLTVLAGELFKIPIVRCNLMDCYGCFAEMAYSGLVNKTLAFKTLEACMKLTLVNYVVSNIDIVYDLSIREAFNRIDYETLAKEHFKEIMESISLSRI